MTKIPKTKRQKYGMKKHIFLFLKMSSIFLFLFSEEKKLSKYVSHRIQGNNVTLTVVFPEEGQYGMYFYSLFNIEIESKKHPVA